MTDVHIFVNIGPGNGLVPNGTKPLPEPTLSDQWFLEYVAVFSNE